MFHVKIKSRKYEQKMEKYFSLRKKEMKKINIQKLNKSVYKNLKEEEEKLQKETITKKKKNKEIPTIITTRRRNEEHCKITEINLNKIDFENSKDKNQQRNKQTNKNMYFTYCIK